MGECEKMTDTRRKVYYANGQKGYLLGIYPASTFLTSCPHTIALIENAYSGSVVESNPTNIVFKEWEDFK